MLVSGITVLIAMAGMFLSGDKTFMSFSVGTMIVVAVAMLGSLTVLPAVLSKLGDQVEKGRIPFVHRPPPRRAARAASGARSSTACSGARSSRPSPPAPCSSRWPCRRSACTPPQTGHRGDHQSRGRAVRATSSTPSPAPRSPAVVAIKADDVNAAPVREAIADLKQKALATGEMNAPIDVETNRDGTVATVEIPLAGNGTDDASNAALATLRDDVLPATLGKVDGVEYAVTGHDRELAGLQRGA